MELKGKTVLITGGGSGIGKAVAARFMKEGADVCIAGRRIDVLEEAAESMKSFPGNIHTIQGDVSSARGCRTIVEEAAEETGRLDILVNSAGVWEEGPSEDVTEEEWDRIIDTNLKGTFFMCRYSIPFLRRTEGSVVNIGSDSGIVGNSEGAAYCASKGGVTLLTKALAVELAEDGIRVNAVCPGDVMSPMMEKALQKYGNNDSETYYGSLLKLYPQGAKARFTRPEEVAETVFFISGANVKPITGVCLPVDFGLTAGYM